MGKVAELEYEIQELYIEGMAAKRIARELEVSVETVLEVIQGFGAIDQDEFDPFQTVNS